jgi:hypothetical protein
MLTVLTTAFRGTVTLLGGRPKTAARTEYRSAAFGDRLRPHIIIHHSSKETNVADRSFQLVVRKGPRPGQVFPLTLENVTVGRDPLADIVLNDPEVSRHHAQFIQTQEGYQLKDLGSTNGSFVDGKRIGGEPVTLSPGQIVMFGSNVTLIYQATSAADPLATMVAPAAGMPEPPQREPDRPDFEQGSEDIFAEPPPTTPLPQTEMPELEEEEEEAPGAFVASEAAGGATEVLPRRLERPEQSPEGSEPPWERPEPRPERPEPQEEVPSTRFPSSEPLMQAPVPDEEPFRVPPPPPPPGKRTGIGGFNQRNVIIAIVVALLLCCCCLLIAAVLSARGLDFEQWEFAFSSAREFWSLL